MSDELTGLSQFSFKWSTGTPPTYTNWAPNEPDTSRTSDNYKCVSFVKKDQNVIGADYFEAGQWTVSNCDFKYSYVCKKPFMRNPPTTITTRYPGCPPGWQVYESKCYTNQLAYKTWQEAENGCKSANGNILSITDRFEQYWLSSILAGTNEVIWIGLTDLNSPGTFSWSSKDPVTFTNWDRNQPGDFLFK